MKAPPQSSRPKTRSPGFSNDITSLTRTLSSFEQRLREALNAIIPSEKRVQKAQESVEIETQRYTSLTSNLRHMRGPADHVVLIEYVEVLHNRDSVRDALLMAKYELSKQVTHLRRVHDNIASLKTSIATAKQLLASYGCVYNFQ